MGDALHCDVAIIGAGTAGLSAERAARRAGAKTLLIDPEFIGTTCANVGCMPSKLLIAAARAAHAASTADVFGVRAAPTINGAAVMARLRHERDHFAGATREEIEKLPDGIAVQSRARFVAEHSLMLSDGRTIEAKAVVVATGSRPEIPSIFEPISDLVLTNETIFELPELPSTLAVVGAGPLGLELAQAMARLGVDVTLLDKAGTLAGIDDETIADRLKAILAQDMRIALGVEIAARTEDGKAALQWKGATAGNGLFDYVLVAAGRPPNLRDLDLKAAGLELDNKGVPLFDRETMRCGTSAIYIAGDADADRPVLHEASAEGAIAGTNAARHPDGKPGRRCVPFSIMFTDPPLVLIGRRAGEGLVAGDTDYRQQGRARIDGQAEGIARLFAEPGEGRLTGAVLLCPGADHLGHLLAWSIESGATTKDLLDRPYYHPTLEEGLKPALRAICKQIGLSAPETRDEGAPSGG